MTAILGSAISALSKFLALSEIILLNLLWGVLLRCLDTLYELPVSLETRTKKQKITKKTVSLMIAGKHLKPYSPY